MDGKDEAIKRTGQEDALKRDADQADVEAHRFRGGTAPDDDGEGYKRHLAPDTDEGDVEGHGYRKG